MRKKRNAIPDESLTDLAREYIRGATTTALALTYNVSVPTVSKSLDKVGIPRRSRREINHMRAPLDVKLLREFVSAGKLSQREMAEALDVSVATIERAMRRIGLKSVRGRGSPLEKNYFWNGGRAIDADGYVLLKRSDHPNATKAGYVREHRLVMEQHLGRYLDRSEVVHHIDGNKQNNALSNLQVFPSNADHLKLELTGKTPNYSADGLRRMRENALRLNRRRFLSIQMELKNGAGQ